MGSLPDALLRVRAAFRRLRCRGDISLPLGPAVPRSRLVRAGRDVDLHRHPRRGPLLRLEEESAELVLSSPRPTIDLVAARDALAKSIGDRARVSTLHDMIVVDVEGARLVE